MPSKWEEMQQDREGVEAARRANRRRRGQRTTRDAIARDRTPAEMPAAPLVTRMPPGIATRGYGQGASEARQKQYARLAKDARAARAGRASSSPPRDAFASSAAGAGSGGEGSGAKPLAMSPVRRRTSGGVEDVDGNLPNFMKKTSESDPVPSGKFSDSGGGSSGGDKKKAGSGSGGGDKKAGSGSGGVDKKAGSGSGGISLPSKGFNSADMLFPLMMMKGGMMNGSPVNTQEIQGLIKQNEKDKKEANEAIEKMNSLMVKLRELKRALKKEKAQNAQKDQKDEKCDCSKNVKEKDVIDIEESIRQSDVVEALAKCRKTLSTYKDILIKLNNYSAYLQRLTLKIQKRLKYNILKSKRVCNKKSDADNKKKIKPIIKHGKNKQQKTQSVNKAQS